MTATLATWLYMSVSSLSLIVQTTALIRIIGKRQAMRLARRGLLRTACCRVAASAVYVTIGATALLGVPNTGTVALLALLSIQILWQVNGLLDSRLAGRLTENAPRQS